MSAPIETTRTDRFRQLWRMVLRESRERNRWRKIIRFRLWMPVVLQIILVVGLAWYTNGRFPGFLNANNINQLLILALPLIVSAIAQTHALLVGYIDLSVGAMISLGVVIASFLMAAEASTGQILIAILVMLGSALALGLLITVVINRAKIPPILVSLATMRILNCFALNVRPSAQCVISST